MCFYRISKHKCSDTPITVYKVMRKVSPDCVNSVYYPALKPYLVGEKIVASHSQASTKLMDMAFALDKEIVHAYQTLDRAEESMLRMGYFISQLIGNLVIVKCEIPSGAEYWLGSGEEIGARELKIVSINN